MTKKVLSAMVLLALTGSVAAADVTYRGQIRALLPAASPDQWNRIRHCTRWAFCHETGFRWIAN